jgi:hypothetical protein
MVVIISGRKQQRITDMQFELMTPLGRGAVFRWLEENGVMLEQARNDPHVRARLTLRFYQQLTFCRSPCQPFAARR